MSDDERMGSGTSVRGEVASEDRRGSSTPAVTLKYTQRFGCIGPACEDHCCYFWRVDIDKRTYDRMALATPFAPDATRERYRKAIRVHKPKKKREPERYSMKMRSDNACCPMLESDGLCHIHAVFGESYLSDTCALYPRKFQNLEGTTEVSAVASCPEASRQLLLHADATDEVPFDLKELGRQPPTHNMDLRDIRPYWRLMTRIRNFVIEEILRDESQSVRERLFAMIWFAKRTSSVLRKDNYDQDHSAVDREIAMLSDPKVRAEIGRRFGALETPSALVLLLARELVRPNVPKSSVRPKFGRLIEGVFKSYQDLDMLVSLGDDDSTLSKHIQSLDGVQAEYRERRDRTLARAAERVDQYFKNFAIYYWYNRNVTEAPDLMTFLIRLLAQMACQRFLLFSHPKVVGALKGDVDEGTFQTALDEAAVDVFYNVGRFMEHGTLLTSLEKALAQRQLNSLAGAVYLLKF